MKRTPPAKRAQTKQAQAKGPSQRQLRAGELTRHALVEIIAEANLTDPALLGVSVTITEVRMGPDLRHATVFVEPLGGDHASEVVQALNRHARFLRGRLGRQIDMKFTPELRFLHDESFDEAQRMNRLFDDPKVRQDLEPHSPSPSPEGRGNLNSEEPGLQPGGAWKDED